MSPHAAATHATPMRAGAGAARDSARADGDATRAAAEPSASSPRPSTPALSTPRIAQRPTLARIVRPRGSVKPPSTLASPGSPAARRRVRSRAPSHGSLPTWVRLSVLCNRTRFGDTVHVCGSTPELGARPLRRDAPRAARGVPLGFARSLSLARSLALSLSLSLLLAPSLARSLSLAHSLARSFPCSLALSLAHDFTCACLLSPPYPPAPCLLTSSPGGWEPVRSVALTTTAASWPLWTVDLLLPHTRGDARALGDGALDDDDAAAPADAAMAAAAAASALSAGAGGARAAGAPGGLDIAAAAAAPPRPEPSRPPRPDPAARHPDCAHPDCVAHPDWATPIQYKYLIKHARGEGGDGGGDGDGGARGRARGVAAASSAAAIAVGPSDAARSHAAARAAGRDGRGDGGCDGGGYEWEPSANRTLCIHGVALSVAERWAAVGCTTVRLRARAVHSLAVWRARARSPSRSRALSLVVCVCVSDLLRVTVALELWSASRRACPPVAACRAHAARAHAACRRAAPRDRHRHRHDVSRTGSLRRGGGGDVAAWRRSRRPRLPLPARLVRDAVAAGRR
jgi:hypothetical protein